MQVLRVSGRVRVRRRRLLVRYQQDGAGMSAAASLTREHVHLDVLSNSALACYRTCPRQFQFRYVLRRRPARSSEALRFGTLFHVGLNAWWAAAGDGEARLAAALVAMRARAAEKVDELDTFEQVKAEELMLGYTARWGEELYETVDVERIFQMPLVNPTTDAASKTYRLSGAIDAIARTSRGEIIQVEHKTTSSDIAPGADYWRKVSALDPQVSTYQAAMRSLGYENATCLYDVVRKVSLRPLRATPEESRKYTAKGLLYANQRGTDETPEEFRFRVRGQIAESPEHYFARGPVVRLEHDEQEHARDVWQTAAMIRLSENAGSFPRNPGACERFGRFCEYFDVCSGSASIADDTRFRSAEHAHEELIKEV